MYAVGCGGAKAPRPDKGCRSSLARPPKTTMIDSDSYLITHPASTSFAPSSPPDPCAPPNEPFAAQTGAIGRRIDAVKWTNSDPSSEAEVDVSRRLFPEAAMVGRCGG